MEFLDSLKDTFDNKVAASNNSNCNGVSNCNGNSNSNCNNVLDKNVVKITSEVLEYLGGRKQFWSIQEDSCGREQQLQQQLQQRKKMQLRSSLQLQQRTSCKLQKERRKTIILSRDKLNVMNENLEEEEEVGGNATATEVGN